MLDFFRRLLEVDPVPLITKLHYQPGIPILLVCGNMMIAVAELAIPLCFLYLLHKRRDLLFPKLFGLFSIFLVMSGATHVMDVVTLYLPVYRLFALIVLLSAVISIITAVVTTCLIPQILSIPGRGALTKEIRERKNSEKQLRDLQEHLEDRVRERTSELESRNDDLSQFAFAASHDLQEPLRMMSVYSEVLGRRYRESLDDEAKEYIEQIVNGSRRMSQLLDDLLSYTRLVRGNPEMKGPVEASAEAALRNVLDDLQRQIAISDAKISWGALPMLCVSEVHLRQLFQNLVSNAIKYRSKATPLIHITSAQQGNECLLSVTDNGIGIATRYHQQVFGLFKRLHGREISGTGMGLPICQKIVERYGGKIWVESDGGKGATFYFRLPGLQLKGRSTTQNDDLRTLSALVCDRERVSRLPSVRS